jgi:hypothetical protein
MKKRMRIKETTLTMPYIPFHLSDYTSPPRYSHESRGVWRTSRRRRQNGKVELVGLGS